MKQTVDSRNSLLEIGSVIVLAAGLMSGCETRVVGAKGIGASSSHPTTEEPAGRDPLSQKVWGKDPQP